MKSKMIDVRCNVFEFHHKTPQEDKNSTAPCPRRFTELVLLSSSYQFYIFIPSFLMFSFFISTVEVLYFLGKQPDQISKATGSVKDENHKSKLIKRETDKTEQN